MVKKKKNGFILQAGILAAAGVITRIIGILYRSPLVAIIGDEGNGYYSTAYTIYTIILLVSTNGIPSAVSKIVAGKLAKKEYRNAHKIFIGAFCYVFAAGGAASAACFLFADKIAGANSALVLRVFTPTIFFSGLLGVYRGYFQAHGSMLQTSFSQVLEQIANAIVSILAALLFISAASGKDQTTQAVYGAMGSALGTGMGVVTALLFMILAYRLNGKMFKQRMKKDKTKEVLSYQEVFKLIITMVTPVIISTCIYNVSSFTNLQIYTRVGEAIHGFDETRIATSYGYYSGKANPITNIPIAFATAMSIAIIPTISASHEKGEKEEMIAKIAMGIKTTMMISIPAAVGLTVLAEPVVYLLYPQKESLSAVAGILRLMASSVVFYSLSTVTNGVLQATGWVNKPMIHGSLALLLQTILLVLMLVYTPLDIKGMAIASVVYSLAVSLMNQTAIRRKLGYRQEWIKSFVLPLVSSLCMGGTAFFVYKGCEKAAVILKLQAPGEMVWGNNAISLVVSVLAAVIVYFILVIRLGAISKKELLAIPKGRLIVNVAEKFRLL